MLIILTKTHFKFHCQTYLIENLKYILNHIICNIQCDVPVFSYIYQILTLVLTHLFPPLYHCQIIVDFIGILLAGF